MELYINKAEFFLKRTMLGSWIDRTLRDSAKLAGAFPSDSARADSELSDRSSPKGTCGCSMSAIGSFGMCWCAPTTPRHPIDLQTRAGDVLKDHVRTFFPPRMG